MDLLQRNCFILLFVTIHVKSSNVLPKKGTLQLEPKMFLIILYNFVLVCGCELKGNKMSTIPYGTFMASKMSANNAKLAKIEDENEREKLFKQCNTKFINHLQLKET